MATDEAGTVRIPVAELLKSNAGSESLKKRIVESDINNGKSCAGRFGWESDRWAAGYVAPAA